MPTEHRLAITIKGGVSLGAYEAGALKQTLLLIANNNSIPGSIKWYVDVITGASAGSMTAAMTGLALIAGSSLNPPDPFYQAWVQGVSVSAMLPRAQGDQGYNLFDATALDRIAASNIRLPLTVTQPHPALKPSNPLVKLLFTLSRLQTDPTKVDTWAGDLQYKEFADSARFDLGLVTNRGAIPNPTNPTVAAYAVLTDGDTSAPSGVDNVVSDLSSAWNALVSAAITSGSFPIAFAPRCLRRWINGGWIDVNYVDGGLYDNDPLGEAINLAHDVDWSDDALKDSDRRFLVVHTEPSDTSGRTLSANTSALLEVEVLDAIKTILSGFVLESQTSGLRGIQPINDQVDQRLEVLRSIATALSGIQPATRYTGAIEVLRVARNLTPKQISDFRGWLIPDLQFADDLLFQQVSGLNAAEIESFLDLALLYDLSSNLVDKVKIKPILVAPPSGSSLSGDPLYGFAGFFDVALRARDFQQGMWDAYQAWKQVSLAVDDRGRSIGDFDMTGTIPPPDPQSAKAIDLDSLTQYKDELEDFRQRVKIVLDSLSTELDSGTGLLSDAKALVLKKLLEAGGDSAIDEGLKNSD
jgi:hypothetical protein